MFLLKYTLLFLLSKKSELKPRFLYRNKVTKSSENVASLVCNVCWVCLCGIIAARVGCGGIALIRVSLVANVVVDGIAAVGGSVLVNTEVTKSQRNRQRQRRLKFFCKNFMFEAWKIRVK